MAMLYETISAELETQIRNGSLAVGDKLPERQLAGQYGVSRTVIREAMRSLVEKGLVETICGKGNYVTKLNEDMFITKFSDYVDNSDIPIIDVAEARMIIECNVSPVIIENADDAVIDKLTALTAMMEKNIKNTKVFAKYDEQFHLTMLACVKNQTIILFTNILNKMTNRNILFKNMEAAVGAIEEHRKMIEAIKKKDVEELKSLISYHISTLSDYL